MHDIWVQILTAWQAQSGLEVIAVLAAIMYLVLAIKENIWCWLFAFISTAIYIYLFHSVSLLSESLLNVYYLIMAVYGWYQWRNGHLNQQRSITSWSWQKHITLILLTGSLVPILGYSMQKLGASIPYLDAFTTCFAVLATIMVAHKVLQNWHYWLVINVTSVYIFTQKELFLTAAMFVLYVILTIIGYIKWSHEYAQQRTLATPT
ncbi:nicotinamide riboside transporter PnuC [Marinicella sp. S1101]|uniref:nicotinamide riboside transporter PnuC n=1 Tax=Marinicella marina TaxID=2996016 RepID=UPI002260D353|nr:nicotinamide riboside transporter PnuC [Marinicella marina]MCX7552504.1 nicotinamide riboside transporter PnuC [Marinicella marina]MDJ1139380.1 nicotinamide riboside transporter PnuC [Marinicella marina]